MLVLASGLAALFVLEPNFGTQPAFALPSPNEAGLWEGPTANYEAWATDVIADTTVLTSLVFVTGFAFEVGVAHATTLAYDDSDGGPVRLPIWKTTSGLWGTGKRLAHSEIGTIGSQNPTLYLARDALVGGVYLGPRLDALDALTGEWLWTINPYTGPVDGNVMALDVAVSRDGLTVVIIGRGPLTSEGNATRFIAAYDTQTLALRWRIPTGLGTTEIGEWNHIFRHPSSVKGLPLVVVGVTGAKGEVRRWGDWTINSSTQVLTADPAIPDTSRFEQAYWTRHSVPVIGLVESYYATGNLTSASHVSHTRWRIGSSYYTSPVPQYDARGWTIVAQSPNLSGARLVVAGPSDPAAPIATWSIFSQRLDNVGAPISISHNSGRPFAMLNADPDVFIAGHGQLDSGANGMRLQKRRISDLALLFDVLVAGVPGGRAFAMSSPPNFESSTAVIITGGGAKEVIPPAPPEPGRRYVTVAYDSSGNELWRGFYQGVPPP